MKKTGAEEGDRRGQGVVEKSIFVPAEFSVAFTLQYYKQVAADIITADDLGGATVTVQKLGQS